MVCQHYITIISNQDIFKFQPAMSYTLIVNAVFGVIVKWLQAEKYLSYDELGCSFIQPSAWLFLQIVVHVPFPEILLH